MIIENIKLNNYKCYYNQKDFSFSNGLNFILGQNGEGKTKFFEALEWLFDVKKGANNDIQNIVSAKKLFEMAIGDNAKVEVEIILKNIKGVKSLIGKRMEFSKGENGVSNPRIVHYAKEYDTVRNSWKEELTDRNSYQSIRNRVIPSKLLSSILFKGEKDLTSRQGISALDVLVTDQTDSKVFERFAIEMKSFEQKADRAVARQNRENKKINRERDGITLDISNKDQRKINLQRQLSLVNEDIRHFLDELSKIDDIIESSTDLDNIQNIINETEDKIRDKQGLIASRENYTENLFDKHWILLSFKDTLDEFSKKVIDWDQESRALEREFHIKLGKIEKEKEILELPIGTPSKQHMVEMLNAEHCKVCNRAAEKGSDPYNYMQSRLQDYLNDLNKTSSSEERLFEKQFIKGINKFWDGIEKESTSTVNSIESNISENFELINRLKNELSGLGQKLEEAEQEKLGIIGSQNISIESAKDVLIKSREYGKKLRTKEQERDTINNELKGIEENLIKLKADKAKLNSGLSHVGKEFEAKRVLFDEFKDIFEALQIQDLKDLSDSIIEKTEYYYKRVNKGYAGKINWQLDTDGKISNFELDGDPSQSQKTRLTLSVLVAIQDILKLNQDGEQFENYPMVMDAPISNFDAAHSLVFLETISELTDQSIILLKDFFNENGEVDKEALKKVKAEKVHVLSLHDSKKDNELHTIETMVENIII